MIGRRSRKRVLRSRREVTEHNCVFMKEGRGRKVGRVESRYLFNEDTFTQFFSFYHHSEVEQSTYKPGGVVNLTSQ